jgi:alkylation response protein AidB-like acyl-CoA dehydrogenase
LPFSFTDEQQALRGAVRAFADDAVTEAATRAVMDTDRGYDLDVWQRLSTELGLVTLAAPEEYGGAGAGVVELAIIAEELGRALYSGPWLSTVLAVSALAAAPDRALAAEILAELSGGGSATVALAEADGSWDPGDITCSATETSGGWTLQGSKKYVAHAVGAGLLVVAARAEDGLALFAVEAGASGLTIQPVEAFDRTRHLAQVDLDATPARRVGDDLTELLRLGAVLSAAESVGGAQAALDLAVDYAKQRVQFGRVIGSFQAVKHMCADRLLDVESARSAAYYAAWAAADESDDLAMAAPLAKALCSDVFFDTAKDSMQIHGGIAFTWEHPIHLYYRRAKSSRTLWGDPQAHRESLASAIGL